MKATIKISILVALCYAMLGIANLNAQEATRTDTFKVYGNCNMCKEHIEGALKKKDGVIKKDWSPKTKMLTVTYDPLKISQHEIKQKIADEGYDSDEIHAKDEDYKKLHKCCQYQRAK